MWDDLAHGRGVMVAEEGMFRLMKCVECKIKCRNNELVRGYVG